ncbi:MAG: hypothetical protein HKN44_00955 [Ilumatobacter sp.]|nr:hypothetical protein [Ilumatobacter sp.]
MATWEKKIRSGGGNDLQPGETLVGGVLLNPPGTTGKMLARGSGGLLGAVLHDKFGTDGEAAEFVSDSGVAAQIPDEPVWFAVTPTRVLVWGHSTMSGKPKGLKLTLGRHDLERVEVEKLRTTYATVLHFSDGTARIFEAPKMMNDPVGFAAAVNGG